MFSRLLSWPKEPEALKCLLRSYIYLLGFFNWTSRLLLAALASSLLDKLCLTPGWLRACLRTTQLANMTSAVATQIASFYCSAIFQSYVEPVHRAVDLLLVLPSYRHSFVVDDGEVVDIENSVSRIHRF